MTKEYLEQSVAKFQELERKKQEFLDTYKKPESDGAQASHDETQPAEVMGSV
jgi:hypothetical protein